ncbi:hypothetical protein OKW26_004334 [Paraburkholderia sp. 32]
MALEKPLVAEGKPTGRTRERISPSCRNRKTTALPEGLQTPRKKGMAVARW